MEAGRIKQAFFACADVFNDPDESASRARSTEADRQGCREGGRSRCIARMRGNDVMQRTDLQSAAEHPVQTEILRP